MSTACTRVRNFKGQLPKIVTSGETFDYHLYNIHGALIENSNMLTVVQCVTVIWKVVRDSARYSRSVSAAAPMKGWSGNLSSCICMSVSFRSLAKSRDAVIACP